MAYFNRTRSLSVSVFSTAAVSLSISSNNESTINDSNKLSASRKFSNAKSLRPSLYFVHNSSFLWKEFNYKIIYWDLIEKTLCLLLHERSQDPRTPEFVRWTWNFAHARWLDSNHWLLATCPNELTCHWTNSRPTLADCTLPFSIQLNHANHTNNFRS